MNLEKLVRMAGGLDTFFKVVQRIMVIALAVAVGIMGVATVVYWVKPEFEMTSVGGFLSVDIGNISFEMAEDFTPDTGTILLYVWCYLGLGILSAAVIYYFISRFRKILQPMKEGNPFHESAGKDIRRIAFAWLVMGVIGNVASALESLTAISILGLEEIVESGVARGVTVNFDMDGTFLIVFFILLMISWIFQYGAELQKLSDETL